MNVSQAPVLAPVVTKFLLLTQDWQQWFTFVYRCCVATLNGFYFSQTASKTVADTTDETSLLSTGEGLTTLAKNQLQPGTRVRFTAAGVISDTGTPDLNMRFKLGGATIMSTGAVALGGTISNNVWFLEAEFCCRSFGETGTVIGQGKFWYDKSTHVGTIEGMAMTAVATVDTRDKLAIDLTAEWGAASASNTITCTNAAIEVLG